jgi:hypothetical protein
LRLWTTANYCRAGIKSLRGTTLLLHLLVFPNTPFSPCAYPIRGAQIRNVRRTSLLPLLSLHGAVPYSYSRKSVQSTLDCRTQNAPPPLTPEMAILRQAGLPYIDRPRIPPHFPCSYRAPTFLLAKPAAALLLLRIHWLLLKRTCCVNTAGCP